MKIDFRARLFLVSAGVITIAAISGSVYMHHQLVGWLGSRVESELLAYARSTRELVEIAPDALDITSADHLADVMGDATNARVTIVAMDGTVLGDSDLEPDGVRALENHANRPEIIEARREGSGRSSRFSTTLQTQLLYVAVPYDRPDGSGVARVALPLDEVDLAAARLRLFLVLSALVELGMALLIGGLAAHHLTGAVRRLVDSTRAAIGGPAHKARTVEARDELGWVTNSVQRMGSQLEQLVGELAEERDLFEAVLEGMGDAVVAVDDRTCVTLINRSARTLLALDQGSLGRSLDELVSVVEIHDLVRQPDRHDRSGIELQLPGSPPKRVLAWAAKQRSRGGVVLVLHDITELRHLETIRRDFIANVSHELRTPVSVIRASAETLEIAMEDDPEGARRFTAAILRNAERMTSIIADLLDLSRMESGKQEMHLGSISLRPVALKAVEAVTQRAKERSIDVEVAVGPHERVMADEQALEQVLLNLLENGLKYSGEGSRIQLHMEHVRGRTRFIVEDDGPGIEPQHRERVFERFYRVDPGRSRQMGGTGLGLAIVKHLVVNMGGRVWLEPAVPHGCRFVIELREPSPG